MTSQEQLLEALCDRIKTQLESGATSDTILKLAESYAWIARPDQPHGGYHSS